MRDAVAAAVADTKARWTSGGRRDRVALGLGLVVGAALVGAFLFGAWHVVFGGFVKGNWRAGAFGIALATGTAVALAVETAIWRRTAR